MNGNQIAYEFFYLVAVLLQIPILIWNFKVRNIPIFSLSLWWFILGLNYFICQMLWNTEDMEEWYSGRGYCDVIVRLICASQVGILCSAIGIARNLCRVMNIHSPSVNFNGFKARCIDVLICWTLPIIMAGITFIIQYQRFAVIKNYGCGFVAAFTVVIMPVYYMWVPICCAIAVIYTVLAVYFFVFRIKQAKIMFEITGVGMTKMKFFRLCFCLSVLVGLMLPLSIYTTVIQARTLKYAKPFSWSEIHDPRTWGIIRKLLVARTDLVLEKAIVLTCSYVTFACTGLSSDITAWYHSLFVKIGLIDLLARWFPSNGSEDGNKFVSQGRKFVSQLPIPFKFEDQDTELNTLSKDHNTSAGRMYESPDDYFEQTPKTPASSEMDKDWFGSSRPVDRAVETEEQYFNHEKDKRPLTRYTNH